MLGDCRIESIHFSSTKFNNRLGLSPVTDETLFVRSNAAMKNQVVQKLGNFFSWIIITKNKKISLKISLHTDTG